MINIEPVKIIIPVKKKPNIKQAVPFFCVLDLERSIDYYVDGLGFVIKDQWVDEGIRRWCWLQNGGAALMLQVFWKEGPHANLPTTELGVGVNICFVCEDALAFHQEVTAKGIRASEPFVGNQMWVTNLVDPDGYRLEFQSYTEVPEGTIYSHWKKT